MPAAPPAAVRWAIVAALAVTLLGAVATNAGAQPRAIVGSAELGLGVTWEAGRTARGPVISGYVVNDSGVTADRVMLRIESLDETGKVVNTRTGYVMGTVPAFNRAYFQVSVPGATSYRVAISSFQWIKGDGGGM